MKRSPSRSTTASTSCHGLEGGGNPIQAHFAEALSLQGFLVLGVVFLAFSKFTYWENSLEIPVGLRIVGSEHDHQSARFETNALH